MIHASQWAKELAERFSKRRSAQGKRPGIIFEYLRTKGDKVFLLRPVGTESFVTLSEIAQAVEAVRQDPTIYENGPTGLRPYIARRVYSPLWAILHLATMDELLS